MRKIDYSAINLLILDVDGVLTDGRIFMTTSGEEMKVFNVRDGSGIKYWARAGKKLAIITGRGSPVVTYRANELGVDEVRLNCKNKLPVYHEVLEKLGFSPSETAVMGDDLTDLAMMRASALAACPCDATNEVLSTVDLVMSKPGGGGCVRELIETILKRSDLWGKIMARYEPDDVSATHET